MQTSTHITVQVVGENGTRTVWEGSNLLTTNGAYDWVRGALGQHLAIGEGVHDLSPDIQELSQYVQTAKGEYAVTQTGTLDSESGVVRSTFRLTTLFPVQEIARNFTELGIHNNNIRRLQTYALFRSTQGEPVVVTVIPGERIQVLYDIHLTSPAKITKQYMINGTNTTVTQVMIAQQGANSILLPGRELTAYQAPRDVPAPVQVLGTTGRLGSITGTHTEGKLQLSVSVNQWNTPQGIQLIKSSGPYEVAWHFDPPIMKTSDWLFTYTYSQEVGSSYV